ncbi:unnamed protein product (macronuclear) [Paramecium tetraurelia]|uniref:Uncharacterized protein n=1 Tax=Paramecium tetraurelia TaxID=5888 RepID=A0EG72_PARTE|nr:uncharacterized protein GSPATT00026637001 [Paramecium tetraurelia]CAK94313.1 unnamed protein product [Paramecium tetraurelia]|eukprot:XP_001461686.1 hypothetical protein (macronuclear) [Paramecium tetraurelia strain d4-2]
MSISLQTMLEQLKNAQRIDLSEMYIGDDGARLLSNYVKNNKNLKCLVLRGNNITAQGFLDIVTALRGCPLLKILSLEWNQIGSDGVGIETLAGFLVSNKSLQHIGLSNNKLTGDQIEPLANALRQNTTLLSLDLRWNSLGKKGGEFLLSAVGDNKAILYLDLNGAEIIQQDQEAIEDILEQHRASNPIQKDRILSIDEDVVEEEEPMISGLAGASVVQHLEQMLEQERIHTMHIKQRMERELDELMRRDKADTRLLEELDAKTRQLESDNRASLYQIEKLRDEYQLMERQQEDVTRSMEEKIRQNEFILNELEKKHRTNLDRALNENNFRARDLVRDWENRCRSVEDRSRQLEQENRILEEELRSLQERQIQLQLTYDQELRDLGRRIQEEEYQKYHIVSTTLDAKIRAMEEARDLIIKRNADAAREYDERILNGKQEVQVLYDELERLKNQNKDFIRQNQELRQKCDSLKQQAKVKESAVEKYESEINTLNAQIEQKRKMQSDSLNQLLNEQKIDRQAWENERIQQTERIHSLEKALRESHAENTRLRQEYQRLGELLQFNVSNALHQAFQDNGYF